MSFQNDVKYVRYRENTWNSILEHAFGVCRHKASIGTSVYTDCDAMATVDNEERDMKLSELVMTNPLPQRAKVTLGFEDPNNPCNSFSTGDVIEVIGVCISCWNCRPHNNQMILGGTTQQIMIIIIILIRMCSINVATSRTLLLIDEHALVRTMQGGQKK